MSLKDEAVAFVKDYFEKNGDENTKVIIGISGGKDSSVVAALCCEALGKERVIGVMMPNGVQKDISDSEKLCKFLGIRNYTLNIKDAYKGLSDEITKVLDVSETPSQYNTNTPSRLRMAALYGVAAIIGNARVSCNGNLSERLAGFYTLWGDGAGDFAPLAYLFVSEVVQLGLELGLPEELVKKAPSDGMCGMTDEDKLGFTYDELQKVATGNEECVSPSKAEMISRKISGIAWKKRLLNLPCFIPSDKDISMWDKDPVKKTLKKIAIFGGTFDPWTSAHQEIIERLSDAYDKVLVIPTTVRYYKVNKQMFSFNERLEMAAKKISVLENVEVCDIERSVDENWRFVDTLKKVIEQFGSENKYYVAIGSDSLQNFKTWYEWKTILKLSKLVVFNRPGYTGNFPDIDYEYLPMENSISSTALRKELSRFMSDEEFEDLLDEDLYS